MPARHVVVDGSNIATEGNSLPSLKQLDEAVREYMRENPDDLVTVVVDATFGHRIPPEERPLFEQAERDGDIVSPPAGAIGRGDAFLLRIADKVGAVVLSNDSFQEFHGEHAWLFDEGRLIGGKPVPGVGWIFTPRSPVRGPKSRESVKEAQRKRKAEQGEEPGESGLELAAERTHHGRGARKLQRAIEAATEEAVLPEKAPKAKRGRRRDKAPSQPLNEPLAFITFIASHRPGDSVEGVVEEFSSHGAYISAGGARCYLPLSAMGPVPPRSAREVLKKGEQRTFVVQAFDAMRRGVELALPGFAHPAGEPTPETVQAEIEAGSGAHPPFGDKALQVVEEALGQRAPQEEPAGALGPAKLGPEVGGLPAVAVAAQKEPARRQLASPPAAASSPGPGASAPPPEATATPRRRRVTGQGTPQAAPAGAEDAATGLQAAAPSTTSTTSTTAGAGTRGKTGRARPTKAPSAAPGGPSQDGHTTQADLPPSATRAKAAKKAQAPRSSPAGAEEPQSQEAQANELAPASSASLAPARGKRPSHLVVVDGARAEPAAAKTTRRRRAAGAGLGPPRDAQGPKAQVEAH